MLPTRTQQFTGIQQSRRHPSAAIRTCDSHVADVEPANTDSILELLTQRMHVTTRATGWRFFLWHTHTASLLAGNALVQHHNDQLYVRYQCK